MSHKSAASPSKKHDADDTTLQPLLVSQIDGPNFNAGVDTSFKSTHTKSWIDGILSQREMVVWCLYWFISNLSMTFYNKHILSSLDVSPIINTFVHMSCTFIGCLIIQKCSFPSLTPTELMRLLIFSFVFALNIVWFQFAVKLTTLSLNQVCRALTPLFQALFSYLIANKIHSVYTLIPLIPVCFGVAFTSIVEINLSMIAFIVSFSSIIVSALKGVLSMKILQQDLKTKLQEYSFLIIVTPMASLWVCFFYLIQHIFFFDLNQDEENIEKESSIYNTKTIIYLLFGGCMAFMLNVASIGTVKRTSATSMGVMANLKQSITIFGSMFAFESNWTIKKLIGVSITIFGAILYSYRKEVERKAKSSPLPK